MSGAEKYMSNALSLANESRTRWKDLEVTIGIGVIVSLDSLSSQILFKLDEARFLDFIGEYL